MLTRLSTSLFPGITGRLSLSKLLRHARTEYKVCAFEYKISDCVIFRTCVTPPERMAWVVVGLRSGGIRNWMPTPGGGLALKSTRSERLGAPFSNLPQHITNNALYHKGRFGLFREAKTRRRWQGGKVRRTLPIISMEHAGPQHM